MQPCGVWGQEIQIYIVGAPELQLYELTLMIFYWLLLCVVNQNITATGDGEMREAHVWQLQSRSGVN